LYKILYVLSIQFSRPDEGLLNHVFNDIFEGNELKEVNKFLESYDPERIVTCGTIFLALNETGLIVTQYNIKDCKRWSTH